MYKDRSVILTGVSEKNYDNNDDNHKEIEVYMVSTTFPASAGIHPLLPTTLKMGYAIVFTT